MGNSEALPVTRELIREYLAGDTGAFRLLLQRQQPSVLHYAGGFLPDAAEAQAVARRALRRGFRQIPRLRRNSLLSSFMLGILRSELSKRGNRSAPDDVDPLWAGLAGLPRVQREVVFLHFQGMALRQVALVRSEAPGLTFSRFGKALCHVAKKLFGEPGAFHSWAEDWRRRLGAEDPATTPATRAEAMRRANPAFIPRNHLVEEAIDAAVRGDFQPFHTLVEVLARPYDEQPAHADLAEPPRPEQRVRQTFCGT